MQNINLEKKETIITTKKNPFLGPFGGVLPGQEMRKELKSDDNGITWYSMNAFNKIITWTEKQIFDDFGRYEYYVTLVK